MIEWLFTAADPMSNFVSIFIVGTCGHYWGEKFSKAMGWR